MREKSLFCGINKPKDPKNLSELEKKHVPVIKAPDAVKAEEPFEVTVEVPHAMEEKHHIQWIELYSRGNFLARIDLTPVFTKAQATVIVVRGPGHGKTTLRAISRCNLHGLWEGIREITVT